MKKYELAQNFKEGDTIVLGSRIEVVSKIEHVTRDDFPKYNHVIITCEDGFEHIYYYDEKIKTQLTKYNSHSTELLSEEQLKELTISSFVSRNGVEYLTLRDQDDLTVELRGQPREDARMSVVRTIMRDGAWVTDSAYVGCIINSRKLWNICVEAIYDDAINFIALQISGVQWIKIPVVNNKFVECEYTSNVEHLQFASPSWYIKIPYQFEVTKVYVC